MSELTVVPIAIHHPCRDWCGGSVPAGHTVATGYVPIHDVICQASSGHQLYPAEVERAYRRQLEHGESQAFPPPTGWYREDGRFVLTDGRNRYVAALMLGVQHLLVSWLEPPA
jgi:hypothetical protein